MCKCYDLMQLYLFSWYPSTGGHSLNKQHWANKNKNQSCSLFHTQLHSSNWKGSFWSIFNSIALYSHFEGRLIKKGRGGGTFCKPSSKNSLACMYICKGMCVCNVTEPCLCVTRQHSGCCCLTGHQLFLSACWVSPVCEVVLHLWQTHTASHLRT